MFNNVSIVSTCAYYPAILALSRYSSNILIQSPNAKQTLQVVEVNISNFTLYFSFIIDNEEDRATRVLKPQRQSILRSQTNKNKNNFKSSGLWEHDNLKSFRKKEQSTPQFKYINKYFHSNFFFQITLYLHPHQIIIIYLQNSININNEKIKLLKSIKGTVERLLQKR